MMMMTELAVERHPRKAALGGQSTNPGREYLTPDKHRVIVIYFKLSELSGASKQFPN